MSLVNEKGKLSKNVCANACFFMINNQLNYDKSKLIIMPIMIQKKRTGETPHRPTQAQCAPVGLRSRVAPQRCPLSSAAANVDIISGTYNRVIKNCSLNIKNKRCFVKKKVANFAVDHLNAFRDGGKGISKTAILTNLHKLQKKCLSRKQNARKLM